MLGDFTVKDAKFGKEIFIKLKIDQAETKYGMQKIITVICVTYVQKYFKIRTLIKRLLAKYQFFTKSPQIFSEIFQALGCIAK